MTAHPIVFVDTETTGLGSTARPWEIAIIRRETDGRESQRVIQVTYSLKNLPEATEPMALHIGGWLTRGIEGNSYMKNLPDGVIGTTCRDEREAAFEVGRHLTRDAILVGVGVHFDDAILSAMFLRAGYFEQPWHYAIVDLKAATWGHLRGQDHANQMSRVPMPEELGLPLKSEALAAALGVEPPAGDERHTALGDARWAARWFDALNEGDAEVSR